ncbi:MAG: type II toxin-antitoxin system VapC family toxin [Anaerolineae bacterium]|nr:type II toxin-antitoxin system VapC family toxin [Candidatus Roseilinea sp.]MDW8450031.1 type II toxin-antitoxin system VapC family toxin [Anaerolineae bacterium]
MDASAVVKRYIAEVGSAWVAALMDDPAHRIFIATITEVEVTSAIQRRMRGGSLTHEAARAALTRFESDIAMGYSRIALTAAVIHGAKLLVRTRALRAYDAVQLATALQIAARIEKGAITFVSADDMLNAVAQAEGLSVADPNDHP